MAVPIAEVTRIGPRPRSRSRLRKPWTSSSEFAAKIGMVTMVTAIRGPKTPARIGVAINGKPIPESPFARPATASPATTTTSSSGPNPPR